MKKIDFHIHTIPASGKDAHFDFNLVKFQEYTDGLSIDAIAITSHNLFDLDQFKRMWTPAPKQRLKKIKEENERLYELFNDFYTQNDLKKKIEIAKQIIPLVFNS